MDLSLECPNKGVVATVIADDASAITTTDQSLAKSQYCSNKWDYMANSSLPEDGCDIHLFLNRVAGHFSIDTFWADKAATVLRVSSGLEYLPATQDKYSLVACFCKCLPACAYLLYSFT